MKKESLNNHSAIAVPFGTAIDLSKALILNGKTLEPQPIHQSNAVEKPFKSEKELTELVLLNSKALFGEHTITLDAKKFSLPFYLLFDFSDFEFPTFYFLDISLSKSDFFGNVFQRITNILMFLNRLDSTNQLIGFLCAVVTENKVLRKELSLKADGRDIIEHLRSTIIKRSSVLLITDNEKIEISQIMDT